MIKPHFYTTCCAAAIFFSKDIIWQFQVVYHNRLKQI